MVHENSGNDLEPNVTAGRRTENSIEPPAAEKDEEVVPSETLQQHHQIGEAPGELDESRICLLDTACTSCMHSKAWRVAYERHLSAGQGCEKTSNLKTFHFADGSSTSGQVNVWKIPVVIGGRPGAIMSAEIETGTTPLLLSISAMEALGMTLFMKERMVLIGSLDVKVPMIKTRTKHLALDLTGSMAISEDEFGSEPLCKSRNDDLYLYLVEEASYQIFDGEYFETQANEAVSLKHEQVLKVGPQGIHLSDKRGEISKRRVNELEKASKTQRALDRRTWFALHRSFTEAEQLATKQFTTTVVFEPWGGSFGITKMASSEFSWTCSQPLAILDGYDLCTQKGEELLWRTLDTHDPFLTVVAFDCRLWSLLMNMLKDIDGSWDKLQSLREGVGKRTLLLVVRVCKHRHVRGRYFLVENPAGSLAWAFEGIMFRLIESCNANYVVSDQCAYGAIDLDSGKPIRKPTGWLSNSEPLLNALGRRCRCKWGAHQQVLGSNSKGARSRQAAAYPPDLCRAVCQGILHTMKLDYPSLVQQAFHLSYPVEGGDMDVDEGTVDADIEVVGEEPAGDVWEREQNKIVRKHLFPRKALFSPMSTETMPCDFRELLPQRTTFLQFEDGTTQTFEDCWTDVHDPFKTGQLFWKGRTEIAIQPLLEEDPPEPEGVVEAEPDGDANMVPAPETPAPATPGGPLRRKRPRTRQLQRGFWQEVSNTDVADLLQRTKEWLVERASNDWQILPLTEDLGRDWESVESAEAEVVLILVADKAKKLRKPQPHASPAEVPLRKSFLLLRNGSCLTTGWEELAQLAPSSQVRPLVAQQRELCVIVFGKPLGDIEQPVEADPRAQAKELQRAQKWASLPRELKLAIRRVHVNLGHASVTQMLRALRVSKASEVAIRACRLFRCEACPRVAPPKKQRPSKLPLTEEFNVQIGLDVFQCKDADGHNWSWLNILCQGTCFQIAVLLEQTHANPTSEEVIKAFDIGWVSWAGYPEFGVFTEPSIL